jgi:hypothetical protein
VNGTPISPSGDLADIAIILARITFLLIGADACTPYIIRKVWGENDAARLALGGPQGDLFLIHRPILTQQKVAINTVHIWLTNLSTPVLPPDLEAFKFLPHTISQLLLDCSKKRVFAWEPVLLGMCSIQWLTNNMKNYIIPDSHSFEDKVIWWYSDNLLLGWDRVDDMMGFNNGIIMAFGMCPPCTLWEFYKLDPELLCPTHFMRGTMEDIWGEEADPYGVMRTTATDWTDDQEEPTY